MSTRTYCVIPHHAREATDFFTGVFEDGVRVLYQGRLQSLLFSHVLSPAHDYVKHINGPLLATLREGGNATLILATPSAEDTAAQPPLSSSSSATAATSRREGIAEATTTAMELYSQLFPLLFRNLEHCATARLSAMTVSAMERVLLDNLGDSRRLRDVTEAKQVTVGRLTSAAEWGTVLHLLEDRHAALEASSTALEGQTACVVTVDLEHYGRLVVVDTASSTELLQQLHLILCMQREGEARAYPPPTPLRDLLCANVSPEAVVQVVCLPAPQDTRRHTMRVLHFGSTVETSLVEEERQRRSFHTAGTRSVAVETHSSRTLATRPRSPPPPHPSFPSPTAGTASTGATRGKHFTRPSAPTPPSVSFLESRHDEGEDGEEVRSRSSGSSAASVHTTDAISGEDSSNINDTAARSRLSQHHSNSDGSRKSAHLRSTSSHLASTPSQLPPPAVVLSSAGTDEQRSRKAQQLLQRRVTQLEVQLRDAEDAKERAAAAQAQAEQDRDRALMELRGKSSLWADLQHTHARTKQENADYAQLVQKLLQQVRVLERDASRQKRQGVTVVKKLREAKEEKETLETQLTRLRKEVLLFRKDATYRAREATLSRIVPGSEMAIPTPATTAGLARSSLHRQHDASQLLSTAASATSSLPTSKLGRKGAAGASPMVQKRSGSGGIRATSPRARRLYETSTEEEGDGNAQEQRTGSAAGAVHPTKSNTQPGVLQFAPLEQQQRLTEITLEELRWRNRHLEQEVSRLQERLLNALAEAHRSLSRDSSPQKKSSSARRDGPPRAIHHACPTCDVMQERVSYFQAELTRVRKEKDQLLHLLGNASPHLSREVLEAKQSVDSDNDGEESVSSTSTAQGVAEDNQRSWRHRNRHRPRSSRSASSPGLRESSADHFSRVHSATSSPSRHITTSAAAEDATRHVMSALLAGCASLQAQLTCAEALLRQRLPMRVDDPATVLSHTDPLSHISTRVLEEHHEAVAALAESIRHIARKPPTAPQTSAASVLMPSTAPHNHSVAPPHHLSLLPPLPRVATAADAEVLTNYLTFEGERCHHLRAFIPTFAQLAVATEHLTMRLEATESP